MRRLERFALAALPARASWTLPGWLCLADDGGHVGRVNAATAVPAAWLESAGTGGARSHQSAGTERAALEEVAASYLSRGLPPLIRLTPEAPGDAAAWLAGQGWHVGGEVLVMTRSLSVGAASGPSDAAATGEATRSTGANAQRQADASGVELTPRASDDWRRAYQAAYPPAEAAARLRLALDAPGARRFAERRSDGRVAGLGMALHVAGIVGLFDVLTVPAFRRRGVARQIVGAMLAWGRSAGADLAFLQVAAANEAAVALYRQLGFEVAYTYLYARPGQAAQRLSATSTSTSS